MKANKIGKVCSISTAHSFGLGFGGGLNAGISRVLRNVNEKENPMEGLLSPGLWWGHRREVVPERLHKHLVAMPFVTSGT